MNIREELLHCLKEAKQELDQTRADWRNADEEAQKAIAELNGKELDGRALTVNEARPMEPRAPRTGGGFGGGRGGFGGGSRY